MLACSILSFFDDVKKFQNVKHAMIRIRMGHHATSHVLKIYRGNLRLESKSRRKSQVKRGRMNGHV